jgi:quercetin dioxygenase-like cupin family protein
MNPSITTLDPPTPNATIRKILSQDGFDGSLITLTPGEDAYRVDASQSQEHILFVVDGEVTVRSGEVNTILKPEDALLLAKGREHSIVAHAPGQAKLLQIEVPPRQVVTPQILSFDS